MWKCDEECKGPVDLLVEVHGSGSFVHRLGVSWVKIFLLKALIASPEREVGDDI